MSDKQPGRGASVARINPGLRRATALGLAALALAGAAAAQTPAAQIPAAQPATAQPPAAQPPGPAAALAAASSSAADPGGKKLEAEINQRLAAEQARRRGALGPATRDAELAAYYNAFTRRIECLSERSYPQAARGRSFRLSVTVSVFADGRLEKVEIERPSGNPDVDAAVLALVRSAAPYEAFSGTVADRYAVLDISSRWQFAYAKNQGGRVEQCQLGGR